MTFENDSLKEAWLSDPYTEVLARKARKDAESALKLLVSAAKSSTDPKIVRQAMECDRLNQLAAMLEGRDGSTGED